MLFLLKSYQQQAESLSITEAAQATSQEGHTQKPTANTMWVGRLNQIENLEAEDLPALHGEAIANGWLDFQIGSRTAGLEYRLSFEGRRQLNASQEQAETNASPELKEAA